MECRFISDHRTLIKYYYVCSCRYNIWVLEEYLTKQNWVNLFHKRKFCIVCCGCFVLTTRWKCIVRIQWKCHCTSEFIALDKVHFAFDTLGILKWNPFCASECIWWTWLNVIDNGNEQIILQEPTYFTVACEPYEIEISSIFNKHTISGLQKWSVFL